MHFLAPLFASPLQNAIYTSRTPDVFNPDILTPPSDPITTGIVFYVASLSCLTAWEGIVAPWLLNGKLPFGELGRGQRQVPFITPSTYLSGAPPPDLETLCEKGTYFIGRSNGISQYMTTEKGKLRKGERELSKEWSEYYGVTIFVFKITK